MGQQQSTSQDSTAPDTPPHQLGASRSRRMLTPNSPPDEIGDEMHELNSRLSRFLKDIDELENERLRLEAQLEHERNSQDDAIRDAQARAEREVERLKDRNASLEQQLRDTHDSARREVEKMKARVEAAHQTHLAQLKQLEADLAARHQDELEALRSQMEDYSARAQTRAVSELAATKEKLRHALEEIDRLKREERHDHTSTAIIAQLRQENSDLQRSLSFAEERHAASEERLSTKLREATEDLQRTKDQLIDKELQFASLSESNAAVVKEVAMFRSLLETQIDRITPSKAKKRRLEADSGVFSFTPVTATPDVQSSSQAETPQSARHAALSRRSSMQRTVEEASNFLVRDTVVIDDVSAAGEFVVIKNTTSEPVSLAGWRLQAEKAKKDFKFLPGTVIPANGTMTVWSGADNEGRMFDDANLWWTAKSIWAARGESAALISDNDKKVSKLAAA